MKFQLMLNVIIAGVVLLTANVVAAQSGPKQGSKILTLRGRVESVGVKEISRSAALIEIQLKMELVNVGTRPVILLQREPLFPGGSLARKPEDFEQGNVLASDAGWPADSNAPEWAALRSNLDKSEPPANEIRVLMPGESRPLETSVRLVVPTDPSKFISSRKKESLATIQQLSPVWLRVVCDLWPLNVEPLDSGRTKLKFSHRLQKRWEKVGFLWLDEIYSEPMMVDVRTGGTP